MELTGLYQRTLERDKIMIGALDRIGLARVPLQGVFVKPQRMRLLSLLCRFQGKMKKQSCWNP